MRGEINDISQGNIQNKTIVADSENVYSNGKEQPFRVHVITSCVHVELVNNWDMRVFQFNIKPQVGAYKMKFGVVKSAKWAVTA